MSEFWLEQNLVGVCFVGLVGSLVGLLGLLGRGRTGVAIPLSLAGLFGAVAGVLAGCGLAPGLWQAPALLAVISASFAALRWSRTSRVASAALKWASAPRMQWTFLLAVSPAAALAWAWVVFPATPELETIPSPAFTESANTGARSSGTAGTDKGAPVALYRQALNAPMADLRAGDDAAFAGGQYASRAIRTAQPSDDYNCHGWVFTGGGFGIHSEDVERILQDNGYQPVAEPLPGDLAIYRSAGAVTHSGIVRTAGAGQSLLVESKWGRFGRYLHAPRHTPYPGQPTYYRSGRNGHLLHGLENFSPPPSTADPSLHG